ncbi:hypothetical protein MTR_1g115580 [Medicago truncatula]|uniref:Uncharacterized protein n=1 Tax=Medicago truncatula TaxID=3880 RepID=A0A072VR87_MEDTR|nr:hypothetical protein MTR_1g115580 [Medicago truncatula]
MVFFFQKYDWLVSRIYSLVVVTHSFVSRECQFRRLCLHCRRTTTICCCDTSSTDIRGWGKTGEIGDCLRGYDAGDCTVESHGRNKRSLMVVFFVENRSLFSTIKQF